MLLHMKFLQDGPIPSSPLKVMQDGVVQRIGVSSNSSVEYMARGEDFHLGALTYNHGGVADHTGSPQ